MSEPSPKRGRGRPPIGVRLDVDVTKEHAELLDELAEKHGLPSRAATVRAVLDTLADRPLRTKLERVLAGRVT